MAAPDSQLDADVEVLTDGETTLVRMAERQWSPSATLPSAAMAAVAGGDGQQSVGVMRDAFALHSRPERRLSEVRPPHLGPSRVVLRQRASRLRPCCTFAAHLQTRHACANDV
jgi:hypothetical protein